MRAERDAGQAASRTSTDVVISALKPSMAVA